jgi:peptide/nickel transport system permease protein
MARYLIRQAVLSLVKLFLFATVMFFLIQIVMPGDFVDQFSLFASRAEQKAMREQLGLHLPIWQRYVDWLNKLVHLDLGTSFTGGPLVEIMKRTIPPTLLVFVTGTALAFGIGLWLGKRTAWRGSGFLSRLTTLGGITLFTSFPPWIAYLVAYFLTGGRDFVIMGERGGLRLRGFHSLRSDIWEDVIISPSGVAFRMFVTAVAATLLIVLFNRLVARALGRGLPAAANLLMIAGLTVASWYALGIQDAAFDIARISWVAVLTYTVLSFGETMIIMQSSMTETLKEEYVTTAHAKGLPASVVRERHAARTALLPVISRLVISLPYLITGVVIIESSIGWPGIGSAMWNALYWQDMPIVMTVVLFVGVLSLGARLVLDVIIATLDPRIRYGEQQPSAL